MGEFQEHVRAVMRRRGVSVADLAARTGRSHSDVRRSLRLSHWWRLDRLLDYADALELNVASLLPAAWNRNRRLTGTPDLLAASTPEGRIAAAHQAGLTVKALNRLGERRRGRAS